MKLSLSVLDEYAKRLTDHQVGRLYEAVNNRKYEKALFEDDGSDRKMLKLYIDMPTTFECLNAYNTELVMHLNENYASVMENVRYKMVGDDVEFKTDDRSSYTGLLRALHKTGFSKQVLANMKDENY